MLQRNMAGDVLAEALTGQLYPEELQARLRPFGIGEQVAVLAFSPPDPAVPRPRCWSGSLEREGRAQPRGDPRGAVVRGDRRGVGGAQRRRVPARRSMLARKLRAELAARFGEVARRPAASRRRDALAAPQLPRGALRAGGRAPAERRRPGGRASYAGPRRLPAAALAAGRRRADLLLPQRARSGRAGRGRVRR